MLRIAERGSIKDRHNTLALTLLADTRSTHKRAIAVRDRGGEAIIPQRRRPPKPDAAPEWSSNLPPRPVLRVVRPDNFDELLAQHARHGEDFERARDQFRELVAEHAQIIEELKGARERLASDRGARERARARVAVPSALEPSYRASDKEGGVRRCDRARRRSVVSAGPSSVECIETRALPRGIKRARGAT
jgi:hypothetical protein